MAYAIQKNTHQDTQSSTETQVREINQKKELKEAPILKKPVCCEQV